MNIKKVSFGDSLGRDVVATQRCIGCGACVLVCPFKCLEYREEGPILVGECRACGICTQVCPQNERSIYETESLVFGRERKSHEEFGVYSRLCIARANDIRVRSVSQDGGVATALLLFCLARGVIDGAIVSGKSLDKPLYPIPMLAKTPTEILESAGTRYFYSPNILAFSDALRQKSRSIAFVGTPCQICAIRKMQLLGLKKYVAQLKLMIGLMCSECFNYEGLMEKYVRERMGLQPNDINKMNIKGNVFMATKYGVKRVPLAEAKQYVRKVCSFCQDFSSELADISLGGLGLEGWTFVVVRTKAGEEIFDAAEESGILETRPVDKNEPSLKLLVKLSMRKRNSANLTS